MTGNFIEIVQELRRPLGGHLLRSNARAASAGRKRRCNKPCQHIDPCGCNDRLKEGFHSISFSRGEAARKNGGKYSCRSF